MSVSLHSLLRGRVRIWPGQDLRREIACIRDFAQGLNDRGSVSVSKTHRPAIAVGEVNVANGLSRGAQSIRDRAFLDSHVEEVGQDSYVAANLLEKIVGVAYTIEKVRFIPV